MRTTATARRVPNAIRYHRKRRPGKGPDGEMTQVHLAKRIGVSAPEMNHIEHGRRLPTHEQAVVIARTLHCTPEDLWSGVWLAAVMSDDPPTRRTPTRRGR